jgi:iron(III) transport system substrate-binding protein
MKRYALIFWFLISLALRQDVAAALPQDIIEKAKQEGQLSFYTNLNIGESKPWLDAFEKKYPFIKTQLIRIGGTAIASRIVTEAQAGRHLWDVAGPLMLYAKEILKRGLVAAYDSPERKLYRSEFKDKEGLWTALVLNNSTMMYNTKLVPAKQAPKSFDDLLLPFWKDKISMDTELYEWFEGQLRVRGREKGLEFMKKLKAQNPVFRRGRTAQAELVAAGEFAVTVEVYAHRAQEMKEKGAPVNWVVVEPVLIHPLVGIIAKNAAHPNVARLFMDYILSKEGQVKVRDEGRIPARSDVPPSPPELMRKDWRVEIVGLGEEIADARKVYAQVFGLTAR